MIAAARLNREITLLEPATTLDAAGQSVTAFRSVWTVPAEIKQAAAIEGVVNGGTLARITFTITIRYFADINESWQLEAFGGRTLAISSIVGQGTGDVPDELVITAHEVRP